MDSPSHSGNKPLMRWEWFRSADWLHRERTWDYLRFMAILSCAALLLQLGTSRGGLDRNGLLLGTDFLSFWSAGQLLVDGASPYDMAAHIAVQRSVYVSQTGFLGFFYPPVFELWCLPLGSLDYFTALLFWTVLGVAAYAMAMRLWLQDLPLSSLLIAVAAFPAVLLTIVHGQTSLFVAALLGAGLWLVCAGRKFLGGALLGLAVIKPQFGLLIPVVLLAGREWRAIGAAVATALTSAVVATLAFGADEWSGWWAVRAVAEGTMSDGLVGFAKMQSVYAALRLVGVGSQPAYLIQGISAFACAVALFLAVRRYGLRAEAAAATLTAGLLTTPFLLDYDLVLLGFPIALLASTRSRPWERAVSALAFALPAFARSLGTFGGVPITPVLVLALFVLLLRRITGPETEKAPFPEPF